MTQFRNALRLLLAAAGLSLLFLGSPVVAQDAAQTGAETEAAATQVDEATARKAEKERAKQERIEEYLRKREERRARRDLKKSDKVDLADDAAENAATETVATSSTKKSRRPEKSSALPRNLARVQAAIRMHPLGQSPTVIAYLDRIDAQEASPQQLAAFGSFVAQNGLTREAIEYYGVALRLEPKDPVLWINVGTLHRQNGELGVAAEAYARALRLNENSAFAHYNLGAVLDEMGEYEEAIEEYKLALTLDPSLGDPAQNPQAANNERLLAVKLMLYKEQSGSLGLPLVDVPGGKLDPDDR